MTAFILGTFFGAILSVVIIGLLTIAGDGDDSDG